MNLFEQWQEAQKAERKAHDNMTEPQAFEHYRQTYEQYNEYLELKNISDSKVIEIGPADIPALYYYPHPKSLIIEPLPSDLLKQTCKSWNIELINKPYEYCSIINTDEIWFLNVLQHTMSPRLIIEKAKLSANIIRFFEPINYGIDDKHLHNFTLDFFIDYFGGFVQYYPPNPNAKNFHTHECAYGIWYKKKDNNVVVKRQ